MRKKGLCLFTVILICFVFAGAVVATAKTGRIVRVGFFPMDGYHELAEDGTHIGMDVEYMEALSKYAGWRLEFVDCKSWDDALYLLEQKKIDLVGSAQFSEERAKKFDYSQLACGYTFGAIVTNGDSTIANEDFDAMKDASFGVVKTYVRKADFYSYLRANGITNPDVKEYNSTAEMQKALDDGRVDAIVHNFMEIRDGQRIVGRFANSQYYYITYKGNDELLGSLNEAIAELRFAQPELEGHLIDKYYTGKLGSEVVFSTEEKNYLSKKGEFRVGYVDGYYPFSYEENGAFSGLSRSIFDDFARTTGTRIKYNKLYNMESAKQALKDGSVDMLAYYIYDNVDKDKINLAGKYISAPLSISVKKNNLSGDIKTVAATGAAASVLTDKNRSGRKVVIYNSERECFDAVLKGKADAAICNSYMTSVLLNEMSDKMELQSVLRDEVKIGVAIKENAPQELADIVEKSIGEIDDSTVNKYMLSNPIEVEFSVMKYVEMHKFRIILCVLLFMAGVLIVVLRMLFDAKKIQRLMYKDSELGVWNLNYFVYWAEKRLATSPKTKYAIAYVNDVQLRLYGTLYGWRESGKLLQAISNVLSETVSSGNELFARGKSNNKNNDEIYARSQSDRFALMLVWKDEQELMDRLNKLIKRLETELNTISDIHNTINIGVCFLRGGKVDVKNSIDQARQALDSLREKNSGVSGIQVFDEELNNKLVEQHKREIVLESADITTDFVAYYQCKTDINTNKIVGAEALVRYINPNEPNKVVSPGFFIPYYEKTGKVREIDFFVLESVCKMLKRRIDAGKRVVPVSCNFSRRHFTDAGFVDKLEGMLKKYEIPKNLIEVEITETIIMEELQQKRIYAAMEEMHRRGILLSIDDFGSGYSSLGVFERVPASVLKLDRSFLLNNTDRERQIVIMREIVCLADALNANVVCEGVETDDDVKLMSAIGAHIAQGYKYSKPAPEIEFEKKLDEEK